MNSGRDDPPDRPYRRNPLAGMEVFGIASFHAANMRRVNAS
jgi:hypothetical protein